MTRDFDEYVSASDDKERKAMERMSAELLRRWNCALQGIDPDCPLFSWGM